MTTLCGCTAWPKEVIIASDGFVVHRMSHPGRMTRDGILTRIAPRLFPKDPPTVLCTRCDLEERFREAITCAWCRGIIFPEDNASLVVDDSHIVDLKAHRTMCAWDNRVIVCHRKDCLARIDAQLLTEQADKVLSGTWHQSRALVVVPR